jgi:cytidylate kinase
VKVRRPFVIVSGLPASGKTTLARALAERIELPLLDKDDVLEALFEGLGVGDRAWRQRLSRSSDRVLQALAETSSGAVLTSFWRHPSLAVESGTPTDWICVLSTELVELYCDCPVEMAVGRFMARNRHPGHNDGTRIQSDLLQQFAALAETGPLGIGQLVRLETSTAIDLDRVIETLLARLPFAGWPAARA